MGGPAGHREPEFDDLKKQAAIRPLYTSAARVYACATALAGIPPAPSIPKTQPHRLRFGAAWRAPSGRQTYERHVAHDARRTAHSYQWSSAVHTQWAA